ncbi:unnamed protein product, partial [Pylaiella littoralis]
ATASLPPGGSTFHPRQHRPQSPPPQNRPPQEGNSTSNTTTTSNVTIGVVQLRPHNRGLVVDPNVAVAPSEKLNAVSARPMHNQRPSLEGRKPAALAPSSPLPRPNNTAAAAGQIHAGLSPPPGTATAGAGGGNISALPRSMGTAVAADRGSSNPTAPLRRWGEFERDRENKVRQGSPGPLPKGMTPELMRLVAGLDVTRMTCEQITEWFANEDSTEKKMQHRVLRVSGKKLLRTLHEAPPGMAVWLERAVIGEGGIQDGMKDERFKSLREGLVRTLAESSGNLAKIEGLKLARKINHQKQVWCATWKLVARGCCQGTTELRCLVRTLLYRLRTNGSSISLDDLSIIADYVRFLLVPSRVYDVAGTGMAKALSGSLEFILKNNNSRTSTALDGDSTERCLQSFVGILEALCPCPAGGSKDTSSTSEAGRRLGDLCIVTLVVVCPGLARFQQMHTRCVMASFLSNLSWHDDNKIQMYQAAEETIPLVLLTWLCDGEMKELAKGDKYVASARLNMATVIWNLSKRADNASRLVQPETFGMLFNLICEDKEEGDVLRRIVSCIQNLAATRRCASDLTDYIANDPLVSNVLGKLFGLLASGGAKNLHQRVLGTFANLAYLCVAGGASTEWAGHLRESLKQFLLHYTETTGILGNFNLDALEARDRQLKFQGVRFEIARFLWCMIRLDLCYGASVDRLASYISELDFHGASAGVLYDNVPRSCVKHHEVVDLLQARRPTTKEIICIATPNERYAKNTLGSSRGGEGGHEYHAAETGSENGSGNGLGGIGLYAADDAEQARAETVRSFALWSLAHYTMQTDDRVHVASHGGLKVLTSIVMGPTGLVEAAKAHGGADTPVLRQIFINLKLAAKVLANLCQAPQNAELIEPAGALAAIETLYSFMSSESKDKNSSSVANVVRQAQQSCVPARYKVDPDFRKTYLVFQGNLWRPVVKEPVPHEDGTVTVHYEVPAGNNECLELSRRVTPQNIELREMQICQGEVPHQINVLTEVAACLSALAMHSSVLKLFAHSGVLGPFLQLSIKQLVPRETCLTALIDTPVKAYGQLSQVMSHLLSLITSIVWDSGDDLPEESEEDDDGDHEDGAEDFGYATGDFPVHDRNNQLKRWNAEAAAWSSRMVQRKVEQALAVRVLDLLVAGADEDAFESSSGYGRTSRQAPGGGSNDNHILAGANTKRRRSSVSPAVSVLDFQRRKSIEWRRQSMLMTSGRACTISGILSHQVLLSGVIHLARPQDESEENWRSRLPSALAKPIESAQRRLEYFCFRLTGSVFDAVRRNWLALDGDLINARKSMKALYELCVEHMVVLVDKFELAPSRCHMDNAIPAATAAATGGALSPTAEYHDSSTANERYQEASDETRTHEAQNDRRGSEDPRSNNGLEDKKCTIHPSRRQPNSLSNVDHTITQHPRDGHGSAGGHESCGSRSSCGDRVDSHFMSKKEKPALQRQDGSFETLRSGSAISGGVDLSREIEIFLLPEQEQARILLPAPSYFVVQMLFRAILSLLSVPGAFTLGEGVKHSHRDSMGSGQLEGSIYLRQEHEQKPGRGRWGSLREPAREMSTESATEIDGKSAGGAASLGFGNVPMGKAGGQLDDLLSLCCRLLRCEPGDGVLHVSLLLVVKIMSNSSTRMINTRVLEGVTTTVVRFLERPSLWVKHASLTLLHYMATRNDLVGVLILTKSSSAPQVVSCLGNVDSEIRLAAANFVGVLAKDAFYSKIIVFPEAPLTSTAEARNGGGAERFAGLFSFRASFGTSLSRLSSGESGSEGSLQDMDGDVDVHRRSTGGCIPLLLAMARQGRSNAELGAILMEQEVALCVLKDLASANNLCREAIVAHGGMPVLVQAAESCSAKARRAVAGLLAELSICPGQRDAFKQAGGLLLLLYFQRSKDPEERSQAVSALKKYGSDALSIYLAIARSSMDVLQKLFLRGGSSNTVGRGLIRPTHDRQLREAAEGLAVCAVHKTSAASILSARGLPMILEMLRVRDFDVQYSCIRALLHLIRHDGEPFSQTMGEADKRAAIHQLTCIVRPVRERAARLLQTRLREFQKGQMNQNVWPRAPPRENSNNLPQRKHLQQPSNGGEAISMDGGAFYDGPGAAGHSLHDRNRPTTKEEISNPLPPPRSDSGDGIQAQTGQGAREESGGPGGCVTAMFEAEPWHTRGEGCVALALGGDMAELARLASQCLELLASQSVTAVDTILSCDVVESLTARLYSYDTHYMCPDPAFKGRKSEDYASEEMSASAGEALLAATRTSNRTRAATRLQRQCIATLSSLTLNSSGEMVRPASREVVEKGLLFLAAFHWSNSVQVEANLALRRQQSKRKLPHPTAWSVQDCLKWLSCVDLDQMCKAANVFLYGPSVPQFRRPGFGFRSQRSGSGGDVRPKLSEMASTKLLGTQVSETSNRTQDSRRPTPSAGGADRKSPENLQQSTPSSGPVTATVGSAAEAVSVKNKGPVGAIRQGSSSSSSWPEQEIARDGLERNMSTAGTRLLLLTRSDLAQAPFHASPEVSKTFMRSLRVLRLHASVATAMNNCAAEIQQKNDSNHGRRRDFAGGVGSSPGGVETGAGGSMWQERRHTLKQIENILLQSKHNVDEIVVTDTNNFIGAGKDIAS